MSINPMHPNLGKSIHETDDQATERAQHHAEQLAEAIRNGGCPKCGTSVGVIHEQPDGHKYRQCGYCGNQYEVEVNSQEQSSQEQPSHA
jgi:transcription elongation factor Elf1